MSRAQLDACAARLDPEDAVEFYARMAVAAALIRQAAEQRRQAWELYRERTGSTARGKKVKA